MKPATTLACTLALLLIFNACKKEKDETPVPSASAATAYDNYSNLKIGNYWIYQEFYIDTLGNSTPGTDFDSCYVEKDTAVNGNNYYKMVRKKLSYYVPAIYLVRDSLSYTVMKYPDTPSKIVFSSTDFTTQFDSHYVLSVPGDTFALGYSQMITPAQDIVVPAGFFHTLDFRTTYTMYPHHSFGTGIRYWHARYAENVGMISETTSTNPYTTSSSEWRLIRYHLN